MAKVKLTIDGRKTLALTGNTILQAANSAGIRIPTLCFHERLKPIGSCGRLSKTSDRLGFAYRVGLNRLEMLTIISLVMLISTGSNHTLGRRY